MKYVYIVLDMDEDGFQSVVNVWEDCEGAVDWIQFEVQKARQQKIDIPKYEIQTKPLIHRSKT